MITSIAVLAILAQAPLDTRPGFLVTSVERSVSFAGKLGDRVELRFTLGVGDHVDVIQVGRQHTRFGRTLNLNVGDRVSIREFKDGRSQLVMPDQVNVLSRFP